MSDSNGVHLIGRLTRPAEIKYLPSGTAVVSFSVAVGKSIPPKDDNGGGQWETRTSFFDCVMFGKTAEHKINMLVKGRQVGIDGELQQDRWEKDGQQHSRVKINCSAIQILALPKGQEGTGAPQTPAGGAPASDDDFKDSIPF